MSLALGLGAAPARAAIGPDAAACNARSGRTALLVNLRGLTGRTGGLSFRLYGDAPADFLASGRWVKRVDVAVPARGAIAMCVAVPSAGRYALAVRHDRNGNGRTDWSDGGGFSRNPALTLLRPRPDFAEVVIDVRRGVQRLDVDLLYPAGAAR